MTEKTQRTLNDITTHAKLARGYAVKALGAAELIARKTPKGQLDIVSNADLLQAARKLQDSAAYINRLISEIAQRRTT